ncbi:hypothetical protein GO730_04585 [Spirosoma sp. HMF3257]|uniref:Uncharacterized protein n=2 Tax=Spirosoma telluris TaxID=2183553 RepID=A0A327NEX1_9BACT|nr:hypothetical protein [Spirosoma telluris]RAI73851.1 hypothetical protein HMF3257_04555 [Spirosoma telluris]
MNASTRLIGICFVCLSISLSMNSKSFGQYGGGYGGGGYGGGMGGRMGGMSGMNQMPSSPRSSVPNIAGDMAMKETKWLKENLSLTKEQLKDVKHLNNEYASQQQDAIKDIVGANGGGRPSPETIKQIREVMLMFNEEKEEKLKPILTPEQWALYQSKKPDMQKEIGGFRPPAPKKDSLSKVSSQP